ncbi:hypothetical protein [Prevotella sp. KH2C16]|uniref:hypothetical protein n=1 Tax=Prevotella sp. KH2C16 TaxID=1855325 RepID=UPI00116058F2|nr:hypothetical protein [Prevotella sp. KH2C16]
MELEKIRIGDKEKLPKDKAIAIAQVGHNICQYHKMLRIQLGDATHRTGMECRRPLPEWSSMHSRRFHRMS